MDLPPNHPSRWARLELGGSNTRLKGGIRVVAGVLQFQRIGNPLADKLVERLAGLPLDENTQGDQVEIAVDVGRPCWRGRCDVKDRRDPRRLVRPPAPQRHPRFEAGGVGQELTHGDAALAVGSERREVSRHWLLEPDGTTLDLLHHQDRREQFGDRGHVEDRVLAHWDPLVTRELGADAVGIAQGVAAGFASHNVAVVPQEGNRTGIHWVGGARRLLPTGNPGQSVVDRLGVESGLSWRSVSQHGVRAGKAREGLVEPSLGHAVGYRCQRSGQRSTDECGHGEPDGDTGHPSPRHGTQPHRPHRRTDG